MADTVTDQHCRIALYPAVLNTIDVSWWAIVIIPNMTIALWAASRAFKRLFNVQQKVSIMGDVDHYPAYQYIYF